VARGLAQRPVGLGPRRPRIGRIQLQFGHGNGVAEGSQLVDAIRVVATGGTALDPSIVEALVAPVVPAGAPRPFRLKADRKYPPSSARPERPGAPARRLRATPPPGRGRAR